MSCEQEMVKEFHKAFDIPIGCKPDNLSDGAVARRINLMTEELLELRDALRSGELVAIADGLADLLYVVYGTAVECGLDMDPIFKEVHRSNMTKVGGHKNEYGKWIKPLTYDPPCLAPIINAQFD